MTQIANAVQILFGLNKMLEIEIKNRSNIVWVSQNGPDWIIQNLWCTVLYIYDTVPYAYNIVLGYICRNFLDHPNSLIVPSSDLLKHIIFHCYYHMTTRLQLS